MLSNITQMAINKQLPVFFRDSWDELALQNKEEDGRQYRKLLKRYGAVAELRLQEARI